MKRWIIRSFFITLLLLCIVGWGVSTCYKAWGRYTHDAYSFHFGVYYGMAGLAEERREMVFNRRSVGWQGSCDRYPFHIGDTDFWWRSTSTGDLSSNGRTEFSLVGFQYVCQTEQYDPGGPRDVTWVVGVPFWFLIAMSGAGLYLVWRKARPKAKGRTFPVELNKPDV